MPVYEYRCSECDFEVELLQKISEGPPKCCKCNKDSMKKLMSSTSFVLNGRGWAKDNYGLK